MKHKKKRKTKKKREEKLRTIYITYLKPGRPKPSVENVASGWRAGNIASRSARNVVWTSARV